MPTHTAHDKDNDKDHISTADRAEQDRITATDRQRLMAKSPYQSLEFLEKHLDEVKKDEEARTKAYEDSPQAKRIKARQEAVKKGANGKDSKPLTEEEAKKASREAMPPGYSKEGTIELPEGAALPPAVREPYWPSAPAWAQPLAEPPSEEDAEGTPLARSKNAHAA